MEGSHTIPAGTNRKNGASNAVVPEDTSPVVYVHRGVRHERTKCAGLYFGSLHLGARAIIKEMHSMQFICEYAVADDLRTYKKRIQQSRQPIMNGPEEDPHDESMLIDFYVGAKASQKSYKRRRKQTRCDQVSLAL
jgi:hypothetical protein